MLGMLVTRRVSALRACALVVCAVAPGLACALKRPTVDAAPVAVADSAAAGAGKMTDFDRRRAAGKGKFLTREQIPQRDGILTSDLVRMLGGVHIIHGGDSPTSGYVAVTRVGTAALRVTQECFAAVVVDGALMYGGGSSDTKFDINQIGADRVVGIELYSAPESIPGEYSGMRASCALVIIWTR
jgi:hypothetical protein